MGRGSGVLHRVLGRCAGTTCRTGGAILHLLGTIALVSGVLSVFCCPLGVVGLPLGIGVWSFALRDLKDMQMEIMDPLGRQAPS